MKRKIVVTLTLILIIISSYLIYYYNDTDEIYLDLYKKSKDLIIEGKEKYAYAINGGDYSYGQEEIVEINIGEHKETVLLVKDENINSMEKLTNYLEEVYTTKIAKDICERLYFEQDGNLYKAIADGVFVKDYHSSEIENININKFKKEAVVVLKVKYWDFIDKGKNEVDYEVIKVKFDRINGEYIYKLDTLIHG